MRPETLIQRFPILLVVLILAAGCLPARVVPAVTPTLTVKSALTSTDTQTPVPNFTPPQPAILTPSLSPAYTPSPTITPTFTPVPFLGLVPEGARARLGKGGMVSMALSPDGAVVAVGSSVMVCLYRLPDAREEWCNLTDYATYGTLADLSFNPQGTALAGRLQNGEIDIWETSTGLRKLVIHTKVSIDSNLIWSPDGRQLAGTLSENRIGIWDAGDGSLISLIGTQDQDPNSISWSPDGTRIAGGDYYGGHITLWDAHSGDVIYSKQYFPQMYYVASLGWSPDSAVLLAGYGYTSCEENCEPNYDGKIAVLDSKTGEQLREIGVGREVSSLSFSPDGTRFMAGLNTNWRINGQVRIYRSADSSLLRNYPGVGAVRVIWLADGKSLLTSNNDGNLLVLDSSNDQRQTIRVDGFKSIDDLAWSPNSAQLATLSQSGSITLWDRFTGRAIREFPIPSGYNRIAWSPDGQSIATTAGNEVFLWDPLTGKRRKTLDTSLDYISDIGWSRDGRTFAALSAMGVLDGEGTDETVYGIITIWDTLHWTVLRLIRVTRNDLNFAWSPDGQTLATSGNAEIHLWDRASGKLRQHFGAAGSTLVWWPDGSKILNGLDVYEIKTQVILFSLSQVDVSIWGAALSPDGSILAAAADQIRLYDAGSGKLLQVLKGRSEQSEKMSFSPDGKTIASLGNGTVVLWDMP